MAAREELVARLAAALTPRVEILEAYLFGSQARGDTRGESDVDVAVYVDEARARSGVWGYDAELAAELMGVLRRNDVDVVILNRAPPLLYHRVLRDGVRLLARDLAATTRREGQAASRWCDWVPQLAKIERAQGARLAAGEFGR